MEHRTKTKPPEEYGTYSINGGRDCWIVQFGTYHPTTASEGIIKPQKVSSFITMSPSTLLARTSTAPPEAGKERILFHRADRDMLFCKADLQGPA
jgi:hypothetical protein